MGTRRLTGEILAEAGGIRIRRGRGGVWLEAIPDALDSDEIRDLLEKSTDDALLELLDPIREYGTWQLLSPADVGAMTDAPILGYNVLWDKSGEVEDVERVYWFPDYMVADPVYRLLVGGRVFFSRA